MIQTYHQTWILASFYINRDYIAQNICINRFDAIPLCKGSCVLEKELKKNEDQQQKLPELKIKEIQLFCQHQVCLFNTINTLSLTDISYPILAKPTFPQQINNSIFRPPIMLT